MIASDDGLNLHDKYIHLIKIDNHYNLAYYSEGSDFQIIDQLIKEKLESKIKVENNFDFIIDKEYIDSIVYKEWEKIGKF